MFAILVDFTNIPTGKPLVIDFERYAETISDETGQTEAQRADEFAEYVDVDVWHSGITVVNAKGEILTYLRGNLATRALFDADL